MLAPHRCVWGFPPLYPALPRELDFHLLQHRPLLEGRQVLHYAALHDGWRASCATAQINPHSSRATAVTILQLLMPRSLK